MKSNQALTGNLPRAHGRESDPTLLERSGHQSSTYDRRDNPGPVEKRGWNWTKPGLYSTTKSSRITPGPVNN